ncbi:sugar kinase [Pseudooceanicola sp.]|uniref:sugar kinase n=1 Tax=Pseudooceanicola sp. TaxID=1914328 RepID=UPI0035C6C755
MTRILSIGECMVEFAPEASGLYRRGFAGDTFNTAWYLRQLVGKETAVAYYSAIGDDAASAEMAEFIRGSGIGFDPMIRPGASVGLYMISLVEGERSFSYWRSASAARSMFDGTGTVAPEPLRALAAGDLLVFSGITVAILLPETRAGFLDLVAEARGRGVTVAFDPNLRPRLWPSDDVMCDWISRAARRADILLPSHEDEARHFGDATPEATAQRYIDAGAGIVVVKNGGGEVLIAPADAPLQRIQPEPVAQVVDSTAAGDAFNAGFLAQWLGGASLSEAARVGCRVSAQVIGQRGALARIDPLSVMG